MRSLGAVSPIRVSAPVRRRLAELKAAQTAERGREVTFTEVIELLLDVWDETEEA